MPSAEDGHVIHARIAHGLPERRYVGDVVGVARRALQVAAWRLVQLGVAAVHGDFGGWWEPSEADRRFWSRRRVA